MTDFIQGASPKARPILFSSPMIRALLDNRKTQTRRIVKPQPFLNHYGDGLVAQVLHRSGKYTYSWHIDDSVNDKFVTEQCPYGKPGDLLWVRESFSYERLDVDCNGFMPPWYWADGNPSSGDFTKPKPSIHMPRWASRLTLEITEVRVERLQEIKVDDAIAEGILRGDPLPELPESKGLIWSDGISDPDSHFNWTRNPVQAYCNLWSAINGSGSWDANPWVWALSFRIHQQNVDSVLIGAAA